MFIFFLSTRQQSTSISISEQLIMISLKKISSFILRTPTRQIAMAFNSGDKWKDRDEASEKVYISQTEKQTIKKLLKKVEGEKEAHQSNMEEFERKLFQIMNRYKINNELLAEEILQLHKNLTK